MRMVWIRHVVDCPADYPNYCQLNWHPVNGVQFAQLDSNDIRGLSAIMDRSIPRDTIRYILGATCEGRRLLQYYLNTELLWLNYVFIEDHEGVRASPLSNPVLEDLLDLLIYCHHPNNVSREPTPVLRGHPYLPPGSVDRWSNEWYAREMWRGGEFDRDRGGSDARADPGPANEAGKLEGGDDSDALLAVLSGASSDIAGAGDVRKDRLRMLSSPGGE